ncbi:hypothetical protein PDESU_04282 [Pontiella desulfatans]|uniref:Uncharacterized protein n=1 Tax=Pontiella desulfatans TaxID=2750659 RepID=A0A6C2U7B9_PONDE|nr:hypothetical protein [Pontiella desulfatans]VGO14104.1 hypothetical protein PDESU_02661 [Pontiella desulfatans]VGO15697.1 hypothetical protein PDESU_04282 [Pontiella desulfatans]
MSGVLFFSGANCLPVVSKAGDQEQLLRAAGQLVSSMTPRQGLVLVALFCRGSSADIKSTLIRLCLFFRAYGRRDILDLLSSDPIAKAGEVVSLVSEHEMLDLYNKLTGIEPDAEELKAETKMLDCLLEGDPCMKLITHFKADLAIRLKELFVVHRTRVGDAAAIRADNRCMVSAPQYDDTRYKPRHWQSVVEDFALNGIYPPAFLKEWGRLYQSVPWPESCRNLFEGYESPRGREPVRHRSVDRILIELLEGELRSADTARLALNASALSVQGLYIPRCLWGELAWSLLDRYRRTTGLISDLRSFDARMSMSIPEAEVLV